MNVLAMLGIDPDEFKETIVGFVEGTKETLKSIDARLARIEEALELEKHSMQLEERETENGPE